MNPPKWKWAKPKKQPPIEPIGAIGAHQIMVFVRCPNCGIKEGRFWVDSGTNVTVCLGCRGWDRPSPVKVPHGYLVVNDD